MLVGREAERARIERLVAEARAGNSGVLVLRGEPGIGKSALCADAREQAEGMVLLEARGFESESELTFAALADFFRPSLRYLDDIPAPQAAALRGALAIGPPVRGDRFTVCAATLSLLAATAEEGPVLAIIDDAQWLDRSSAEAFAFAARRLEAEGVAVLVAARAGHTTAFDRPNFPRLDIGGLTVDAAAGLVEPAISPSALADLVSATGGNPLALLELPGLLTPEQLAGSEPLDELLRTSDALQDAYLLRVRRLPGATQTALLIAAASGSPVAERSYDALGNAGLGPGALDPAEEAGLISISDGLLEFRHPLLRAAVYHGAPAGVRLEAHRMLAAASLEQDRRAWHLAAATPDADAHVAGLLDETALAARRRGGHAEAAAAHGRAADLSGGDEDRARRLREAADDARRAGEAGHALELLDGALAATKDPQLRAQIQHLRSTIEMWRGAPMVAYERLTTEAARIVENDPAKAAWMLTDAGWACFMAGEIATAREVAERAFAAAERAGDFVEILATALLGIATFLSGDRQQAERLLRPYEPLLDDPEFFDRAYYVVWPVGEVLIWLEDYRRARDVLRRLTETARARSAPSLLPYTLTGLAELEFRTGAWPSAYANACEGVRLAEETEQETALAFALAALARIEAAQGREDECRAHVARATELAAFGVSAVTSYSAAALALLELGVGRSEEAVGLLEQIARRTQERGMAEPSVIPWAPDLVEAYARSGRTEDARETLTRFEREARGSGGTSALAAAARCRGLLADAASFEAEFTDALALHDQTPTPFERARTALCLGEKLRRSRRRADARVWLRAALDGFERLGAAPWAERARAELRATGENLRRSGEGDAEELTAQELQVALLVARGGTNREVGAALFLSPKTIESHLGHIYRKLNVRSRTELAALFAAEYAPAAA